MVGAGPGGVKPRGARGGDAQPPARNGRSPLGDSILLEAALPAPRRRSEGFTLVELLIVILVIGILAAIAVPQFVDQSYVAKEAALRENLRVFRDAIDRYYQEHKGAFPGCVSAADGATPTASDEERVQAFLMQLLLSTDERGRADPDGQMGVASGNPAYRYGPYRKGMQAIANPLPDKDGGADPRPDQFTVTDAPGATEPDAEPVNGWKFNCRTGRFIANSNEPSSDGSTTYDRW